METINLPLTCCFDSKYIELAEKFEKAEPDTHFKLFLYDSGYVRTEPVLAFHEILQKRPKGITLHIHSHISLQNAEVLVWLAGDTRTLRPDAWIHFREYPRHRLGRSDFQQFQDSLEGYEAPPGLSQFEQNYLQIERLVKKHLPEHMINRRVWAGELAEWNIIKPALAEEKPEPEKVQTSKPDNISTTDTTKQPKGTLYTPRLL